MLLQSTPILSFLAGNQLELSHKAVIGQLKGILQVSSRQSVFMQSSDSRHVVVRQSSVVIFLSIGHPKNEQCFLHYYLSGSIVADLSLCFLFHVIATCKYIIFIYPRQLIDLDLLNFEYRIVVAVFCRQAWWKKSKQTFKIQHVQINELPRTQATKVRCLYQRKNIVF